MDMRVSGRGMPADAGKLVERHLRHCDHIIDFLKKRSDVKHPSAASRRPTLTVSGAVGSGRGRLASALARELGYELFGREILDAVALDLGCPRKLLDSLDESAQSNIQLMFETWLHGRIIENQEYIRALFRVIGSLAEQGGVVILGRGAAHILGPRAALRIRVEAPLPMRVRRIIETHNLSEDEARQFVETKDHEQRKFHTQFFHTSANDPLSHDLILNLERLSPDKALDLVMCALAARGIEIRRAQI